MKLLNLRLINVASIISGAMSGAFTINLASKRTLSCVDYEEIIRMQLIDKNLMCMSVNCDYCKDNHKLALITCKSKNMILSCVFM